MKYTQNPKQNNVTEETRDLKSVRKAEQVRRRMEEEELIRKARQAAEKLQQSSQLNTGSSSRPVSKTDVSKESRKKEVHTAGVIPEPKRPESLDIQVDFEPRDEERPVFAETDETERATIETISGEEDKRKVSAGIKEKTEGAEGRGTVPGRAKARKANVSAPVNRIKTKESLSYGGLALQFILSLLVIIAVSALITYLALLLQPEPAEGIKTLQQPFEVLFLNFLPIALTMLLLSLFMWNVGYAGGITALLWFSMAVANTLKIQARDEALAFQDIFLLKEGLSATQHYVLHVPVGLIFLAANLVLILFFLGRIFLPRKKPRNYVTIRVVSTVLAAILMIAVIRIPMASKERFESFDVENEFYVTGVYNQLGFPYCFTYYLTKNNAVRPENYSESTAKSYEKSTVSGKGKDVNIIMVMNESFTDLSDYEIFHYPSSEDPLKNFHALSEESNTYAGHIVVHWIGGGTANTEYDVTTGMQTEMLDSSSASAFRYVKNDTDSIFRVFNSDGYRTMFIHPGDAWFYNRENVYPRLGTQEAIFLDDMDDLEYKGEWATDDSLADYTFQKYEETLSEGKNLFAYITTIQNHMSYDYGKYGDGYTFKKVYTDKKVSYDNRAYLPVYLEGVSDADQSLKKMTDYFSGRDEPVVLVFFGDHFPALGPDREVYKELGLPIADETGNSSDDPFCAYEPPFIIWVNDAAAEELDFEKTIQSLDLPEDGVISANYLGAVLLELTGREEEDSFFQFLNEMRRELPVVSGGRYKDAEGNIITKLSEAQQKLVDKFQQWSYYRLTHPYKSSKKLIIDNGSEG